ncbi:hypothetical protein BGZ59_003363 [Podila verticillata]|nr:hypothetical protein BGZ59_003363 [Podila verticillata]
MPINLLQLPHILEAIAYTLSFDDLLSCVLVNHTWYHAITPLLWEDVITYRSEPTDSIYAWDYQEYFLQDERQGFLKNAHHIRALTCQHSQLLVLNNTNCINLVEVNYVVDGSFHGLPELTQLIIRNPGLRAVSVESKGGYHLALNSYHLALNKPMSDFLDVLDQFLNISCVYLGGVYSEQVFSRLLKRVRQEPHQIKKLTLQRPDLLTRSRRGPQQAWVARESPMVVQIPEMELWRTVDDKTLGNNGRWENEQWGSLNNGGPELCVAVMETDHELQLVFPNWPSVSENERFLARYTHCQHIDTGLYTQQDDAHLDALLHQNPNLHKLHLHFSAIRGVNLARILHHPHIQFSSLRLHTTFGIARASTTPNSEFLKHLPTLVDLDLDYRHFTMNELLYILEYTPQLQSIRVPSVTVASKKQPYPHVVWASNNLQKVSLGLYLQGDQPDLQVSIDRSLQTEDRAPIRARSARAATLLAPLFMEQLNSQPELRELELSFNNRLHPKLSPFLQLSLDPTIGLPQLSNLRKLQSLVITGLAHRLGQQEIEWMAQHWALSRLEVPILLRVCPNKAESLTRVNFTGEAPAYHKWFPQLHVVVPVDCYSCGRCRSQACDCRGLNEAFVQAEYNAEAEYYEQVFREDHKRELERDREMDQLDDYDDYDLGRHYQHKSGFLPRRATLKKDCQNVTRSSED